jgi:hypothetical protein
MLTLAIYYVIQDLPSGDRGDSDGSEGRGSCDSVAGAEERSEHL